MGDYNAVFIVFSPWGVQSRFCPGREMPLSSGTDTNDHWGLTDEDEADNCCLRASLKRLCRLEDTSETVPSQALILGTTD